ncbi:hypothetical protein E2C01_094916 [Portunus trituberculatus]|uniref:Uncharacterized protein n=1 Tax=Portunus trituberculatus TaxID=210409 RepID=A0A5B7JXF1_PORTR|nr:hypothetical protein [Portunus trituberculatus]
MEVNRAFKLERTLAEVKMDSSERPRKLPTYLITRYPVGVDPNLSKELEGLYSAVRTGSLLAGLWSHELYRNHHHHLLTSASCPVFYFVGYVMYHLAISAGVLAIFHATVQLLRSVRVVLGVTIRARVLAAPHLLHPRAPRPRRLLLTLPHIGSVLAVRLPEVSIWHGCSRRKAAQTTTPYTPSTDSDTYRHH